jgi:ribose 5-phosphate isomerase B
MKIAIGSDHAGFLFKREMIIYLRIEKGFESVKDFGTYSTDSCDYPDYAHKVAQGVENGDFDYGIVICGSGQGVNIVANKHKGVRSVLAWTPEIAKLGREHNNANVLALPGRFISEEVGKLCIDEFLNSTFEERHSERINKIEINNDGN